MDFPSGRWLRIFLPVQWTWVPGPGTQIPLAAGPLNPRTTPSEAAHSRACAPPREKPPNEKPTHHIRQFAPAHHNYRKPMHSKKSSVTKN